MCMFRREDLKVQIIDYFPFVFQKERDMAERNSPTEEGDVSESTNAAYRHLSYADDLVVRAPTRRDFAEISEGEDVLEIEY